MRLAIISDIHSNLPALEAVMSDIGLQDPDQVWCLGDVVGYGADPDACAEVLAEVVELCLAGNHDLVVRGDLDVEYFAAAAGEAARWTKRVIQPATLHFLEGLMPLAQREGLGLYHASPRDPVWEYVLSVQQASDCLDAQQHRVCLIGHSHVALYFQRDGEGTTGRQVEHGEKLDIAEGEWLLNPGSVGQPRDGDRRAAYLLLDTDAWSATWHRVDYDVQAAATAILDAGLPRGLAERLYEGF